MALATSVLVLVAVGFFALVASALGHRILRLLSIEFGAKSEHLLFSVALGFICLEVFLFLAQNFAQIRMAVLSVVMVTAIVGAPDLPIVIKRLAALVKSVRSASNSELILSGLVGAVMTLQGLAATAPVTGSDALHYHFTVPRLILSSGFHPDFFLSHSFFCGQSHLLILTGLALGSSRIAMGLLFLGGALAALAGVALARLFTDRHWSWVVALVFLLTPVVFWQISISGAPDIWMAFFATLGALAIARSGDLPQSSMAILIGALAGAVAGTKYTGCIVALTLAVTYFWKVRSSLRYLFFAVGALLAGVWPYLRNLAWTKDPVFPFLTSRLFPERVNAFALASYLADTGAGQHKNAWFVIRSIFFAGIDAAHPGFWQYFGPLVLVFAPLLVLLSGRTCRTRTALAVWMLSAVGISATSGMTRFLLPVFPIAIALVLAGVPQLRFSFARYASMIALFSFVLMGMVGLFIYDGPALAVAAGVTSPETYLQSHAPEYGKVQFVNQVLAGRESEGFALVLLRHTYYLRIPFLYGDPSASWAVDPARLQTPDEWRVFLATQRIRWVIRSANYPRSIAAPLLQLETQGALVPIANAELPDFRGLRISEDRQLVPIVVLEVRDSQKASP